MNETSEHDLKKFGFQDITILALSIYVILAQGAQATLSLDPEVSALLDGIDFFVCLIFLADFALRFRRAPSKLEFMKWGWIDLISSIPLWGPLRWGRFVRVIRILRVLRAFRSMRHLLAFLYRDRGQATLATAALSVGLLIIVSAIAILIVEAESRSSIKSPIDAIWWAISTVTTVGYGDVIPSTTEGKFVAMVLMIAGVALFGVFTGMFARILMDHGASAPAHVNTHSDEIEALRKRIEALEHLSHSNKL